MKNRLAPTSITYYPSPFDSYYHLLIELLPNSTHSQCFYSHLTDTTAVATIGTMTTTTTTTLIGFCHSAATQGQYCQFKFCHLVITVCQPSEQQQRPKAVVVVVAQAMEMVAAVAVAIVTGVGCSSSSSTSSMLISRSSRSRIRSSTTAQLD